MPIAFVAIAITNAVRSAAPRLPSQLASPRKSFCGAVGVGVDISVGVGVDVGVSVATGIEVGVSVSVAANVTVNEGALVEVGLWDGDGVAVGAFTGVAVALFDGVADGVSAGVAVELVVGVGVAVTTTVAVVVGVTVATSTELSEETIRFAAIALSPNGLPSPLTAFPHALRVTLENEAGAVHRNEKLTNCRTAVFGLVWVT